MEVIQVTADQLASSRNQGYISKTYSLSQLLWKLSQDLLEEYEKNQGGPLWTPGYPPSPLYPAGVPQPQSATWGNGLNDEKLLQHNFIACISYSCYLQVVQQQQQELNPKATSLHTVLETVIQHMKTLMHNIETIMVSMNFTVPKIDQPTLPNSNSHSGSFQQKLLGYRICLGCNLWLERTVKDFALLASRYPSSF
ncbi:cardiotrophin-1-like [Polypterus senegalus]|uniref:cardiotrophin-1-like n=1 Tax=Polypterus senegalus TaxID=55291 RepID=UPI001962A7D7|nr:cardiotrophin-1-like [Polypterus senegalus]